MKIKKLKKLAAKIIALTAILSVTLGGGINASAATLNIATKITHIVNIKNKTYNGSKCTNIGGLSVSSSDSNRRMYVLKSAGDETEAVLYFFSDYTQPNSNYGRLELRNLVGHANAMAIDDNYIYITCWKYTNRSDSTKNDIVRISRNKIWDLYKKRDGVEMGKLTKNSAGVTVFSAVKADGSNFDSEILSITKYKSNGQFIINNGRDDEDEKNGILYFTTASIINGKFVVSQDEKDKFTVNTGLYNTTGQDVGYSSSCGFFIARWDGVSKIKNTIVWIKLNSLSGNNRVYTQNNSSFRHIMVNRNSSDYTKYEIESLSFDCNNNLYASVNVFPYDDSKDCVVKIQRASAVNGSYKFLASNIGK